MTINIQLQQQITPELSLYAYNDIPVLHLQHAVGSVKIALQGAHLFSWQPTQCQQDVLWLSEIEPFETGTAIRGGIPICYPWFGNAGTPAHGFARTSLWQLSDYEIRTDKVRLVSAMFLAVLAFPNSCATAAASRFTNSISSCCLRILAACKRL